MTSLLTDPATLTSITLRVTRGSPIRVKHVARVPAQDVPGALGDLVEWLGTKARRIAGESCVAYTQDGRATELAAIAQLKVWHAAGTLLEYTGPNYVTAIVCVLDELEVDEAPSNTGVPFRFTAIELTTGSAAGSGTAVSNAASPFGSVVGAALTIQQIVSLTTNELTEAITASVSLTTNELTEAVTASVGLTTNEIPQAITYTVDAVVT